MVIFRAASGESQRGSGLPLDRGSHRGHMIAPAPRFGACRTRASIFITKFIGIFITIFTTIFITIFIMIFIAIFIMIFITIFIAILTSDGAENTHGLLRYP